MLGVEAFNLINARASVLGQSIDVDLALRENDPHADGVVAQAIYAAFLVGDGIVLQPRPFQQQIELTLEDARRRGSVGDRDNT